MTGEEVNLEEKIEQEFTERQEDTEINIPKTVTIPVLLIISIVAGIILHPFTIVGAGERGVLLEWGAVQTGSIDEGWEWRVPIYQKIIKMDVKVQRMEAFASAASKDLQDISTTVVLNYRLNPGKVDTVYQTLRKDYEIRIIDPTIQESVKAVTARYNAEELITKRPVVKREIKGAIKDKLLEHNVLLVDLSITNFQFSPAYAQAIEKKQVAEQLALEAERVLQRKTIEKEQIIVTAEGEKQRTILDAEGKAEALRLQRLEITPELNKYKAIEAWDGVLPQFIGSPILPFLDIDTALASTEETP